MAGRIALEPPPATETPRDVVATPAQSAEPRTSTSRVLQVVLSLTPGGTEYLVVELCKRLHPEFGMAVCCLDDEGAWAPRLRSQGLEIVTLGRRPGFRPDIGFRIARIAAAMGARLLHCHHYSPFVYGRIANYRDPTLKLIYTEHGRLSDAPPSRKRRLVNPILSRFDGPILAVSHELRNHLVASRFPAHRVNVIHNGIIAGTVPPASERRQARRALGLDDDAFVAMTVARLDSVKDLGTLFDAFALARRHVPRSRLVVVGEGPERAMLEARAGLSDLAGSVTLIGYRPDVRALLPAADLFVNSSISEGISITILEAMASGLPVVVTAVGGTPEVVDDTTGVLVPSRDPQRLGAAIMTLAFDRARREALGRSGRRRLESQFTIELMVDRYARTYRRLLD